MIVIDQHGDYEVRPMIQPQPRVCAVTLPNAPCHYDMSEDLTSQWTAQEAKLAMSLRTLLSDDILRQISVPWRQYKDLNRKLKRGVAVNVAAEIAKFNNDDRVYCIQEVYVGVG